MNKVRALVFCTAMLSVGAFAYQYPAGSQSPQSQQPQGGMQPGQPSQTQPSQTQPSQAQPGQPGQPGQAGQQPGAAQSGGSTLDDQVKILAEQLNLTPDQQTKVKAALEDQHTQAMSIIQDQSLQRDDKIQKIHALREETIAKVRGTLTTEDQKTKFDQMVQSQDQRTHQAQPQQAPPPQPK